MAVQNNNVGEVHRATVYLLKSKEYRALVRQIDTIIKDFDQKPEWFQGEVAVLNVLIDLGRGDYEAYQRVMDLVHDYKQRRTDDDRAGYQRDIMRERRAREYKALELHELVNGKVPKNEERKQFFAEVRQRWARAQAEELAAKGPLSWEERNEFKRDFWERVDQKLDANLEDAKATAIANGRDLPRRDPRRLD